MTLNTLPRGLKKPITLEEYQATSPDAKTLKSFEADAARGCVIWEYSTMDALCGDEGFCTVDANKKIVHTDVRAMS